MTFEVDAAVAALWDGRVPITHGLSEDELRWNESRFDIEFGADHVALLRTAVPTGPRWPDWRSTDSTAIRASMSQPVEGVLFDVEHSYYWHHDWGTRPRRTADALKAARHGLACRPRQVPIYGHRYQTTAAPTGSPVLSIYQTDVIIYGMNLLDYLRREFLRSDSSWPTGAGLRPSDPWLALALRE